MYGNKKSVLVLTRTVLSSFLRESGFFYLALCKKEVNLQTFDDLMQNLWNQYLCTRDFILLISFCCCLCLCSLNRKFSSFFFFFFFFIVKCANIDRVGGLEAGFQ